MTQNRSEDRDARRRGSVDAETGERIARDLDALRQHSARDLPAVAHVVRRAMRGAHTREDSPMSIVRTFVTRPWGATLAAAIVLAFTLGVVPIPFERTVGQRVRVSLPATLGTAAVDRVAHTLAQSLGTADIRVVKGERTILEVAARGRTAVAAKRIVAAVVAELSRQGVETEASVTPWTERASGNLYAYTATRFHDITVQTAGRTDAEIAADVRSQLEGMGIEDAKVSYARQGETATLTIEGRGDGGPIKATIVNKASGTAASTNHPLQMSLLDASKYKGKSDAEIKALVDQELRQRGFEGKVEVTNGRVTVQGKKEVHK